MEDILLFIQTHADKAYWIFFILLLLSGLNIPISEDIILIFAGVLSSLYIPEQTFKLYFWVYLGCLLSAWEAYWLGRLFGQKLYNVPYINHIINPERMAKLKAYYDHYGIFTFIVGRFVSGGVRNALFMTSGMTHMPFLLFAFRDAVALLISCSFFFGLGHFFGHNYEQILHYLKIYSDIVIILLVLGLGTLAFVLWNRKQ